MPFSLWAPGDADVPQAAAALERAQSIADLVERFLARGGGDPAALFVLCVERDSAFWETNQRDIEESFGAEAAANAARLGYAVTVNNRLAFARALAAVDGAANAIVIEALALAPEGSLPVVHCTAGGTACACLRLVPKSAN
jgi:hypothetical protein